MLGANSNNYGTGNIGRENNDTRNIVVKQEKSEIILHVPDLDAQDSSPEELFPIFLYYIHFVLS